jgi:hypothetical protein
LEKNDMHHNIFDQTSRTIKSKDNVFGNFLVEKGLYDEIEITSENIYELADLIGGHVKINVYCPKCAETRVFSSEAIKMYRDEGDIMEFSLEEQVVSYQSEIKNRYRILLMHPKDHGSGKMHFLLMM